MTDRTCAADGGDQREAADSGYFAPLASARHMLLTTFKRDGVPVSTSVYGVVDGDRAYFCARNRSCTVKRLRHTDAVQVTPCGVLGFFTHGSPLDATAQPLSGEKASLVAAKLDRRYPVRRSFLTWLLRRQLAYYELLADDAVGGQGGLSEGPPASLIISVHTSQRYMHAVATAPPSLATVYTSSTMCRLCPSDRTRITTVSMSLPAPRSAGA
jgi:PPOX class probable F420-dependent enzyme